MRGLLLMQGSTIERSIAGDVMLRSLISGMSLISSILILHIFMKSGMKSGTEAVAKAIEQRLI